VEPLGGTSQTELPIGLSGPGESSGGDRLYQTLPPRGGRGRSEVGRAKRAGGGARAGLEKRRSDQFFDIHPTIEKGFAPKKNGMTLSSKAWMFVFRKVDGKRRREGHHIHPIYVRSLGLGLSGLGGAPFTYLSVEGGKKKR